MVKFINLHSSARSGVVRRVNSKKLLWYFAIALYQFNRTVLTRNQGGSLEFS